MPDTQTVLLYEAKTCVLKIILSYNFRYGLGMIYYKQEKFSLAEMHFQKALDINPQSSVLLCHIGVVSNFVNIAVTSLLRV
jgi:tetratricopeptide (TPR) repeat protein